MIGGPYDTEGPLQLGGCALFPVGTDRGAGRQLEAAEPGLLAAWLATDGPGDAEELDPQLSNGVSIRLLRDEAGT